MNHYFLRIFPSIRSVILYYPYKVHTEENSSITAARPYRILTCFPIMSLFMWVEDSDHLIYETALKLLYKRCQYIILQKKSQYILFSTIDSVPGIAKSR